jgi:3-dehydroquinate dehydratase-1
MGEHGTMSRVFFGALGSRLTYCAGSHHVSGQLSLEETRSLLDRFYPS